MMLGNGSQTYFEMPGTERNMGRLSAYETATMKPIWTFQQRSPFLSAVLSTGGNLAFVGDFDRRFRAVDVKNGKTLWTARLGTTVQGYPSRSVSTDDSISRSPRGWAAEAHKPSQQPCYRAALFIVQTMARRCMFLHCPMTSKNSPHRFLLQRTGDNQHPFAITKQQVARRNPYPLDLDGCAVVNHLPAWALVLSIGATAKHIESKCFDFVCIAHESIKYCACRF